MSALGSGSETHEQALREGRCGIVPMDEWEQYGLRSRFAAPIDGQALADALRDSRVPARRLSTMGPLASQAVLASEQAVLQAELAPEALGQSDTACILGAGVGSMPAIYEGARRIYEHQARKVKPFSLLQSMSSAPSAHVTQTLGIGGRSYTVASACASALHAIGHSFELIRAGALRIAITGGVEELNIIVAAAFEALRTALSREREDASLASLPFHAQRSGLVLGAGAGILVLEELEAARERGARIYGEILGFAANSSANDLVLPEPSGERAHDCMQGALRDARIREDVVDYVNTHGTGTPAGDLAEGKAIGRLFAKTADSPDSRPWIGSTKGFTGHALGAAGGLESIFSLLMLQGRFLAGMPHLDRPDPELETLRFVPRSSFDTPVTESRRAVHLCSSFGFGGTNASLVLAAAPGARSEGGP